MVAIPARLADVDAEWITTVLHEEGHEAPEVTKVTFEPMPKIVGVLGEVGIFTLSYAGATDLPERLVGKCALDDDIARMYNQIMHFYQRETGFYRDLAEEVPLTVPGCWAIVEDDERHLLLLEYIGDGTAGDAVESTEFATMKRLVGDLAAFHGRYWMSERVRDLPWTLTWRAENFLTGVPIVQGYWEMLKAGEPDLVPPELVDFVDRTYFADVASLLAQMADRPWTFIHGDYQLDNMIFRGPDVVVVDWQGCMISFPGMDLGHLLATSASEETIAREDELLDHYVDVLRESGGPAWSREDLLYDLAWSMLFFVPGISVPYQVDYSETGPYEEHLRARFSKHMHECLKAAARWETIRRVDEQFQR